MASPKGPIGPSSLPTCWAPQELKHARVSHHDFVKNDTKYLNGQKSLLGPSALKNLTPSLNVIPVQNKYVKCTSLVKHLEIRMKKNETREQTDRQKD